MINVERLTARDKIIREKGTNRSLFFRGMVDKYQWVDVGSSYLPSELQAAYLWGQLERAEDINQSRLQIWLRYYEAFLALQDRGKVTLPAVPEGCVHNAHMFYLKTACLDERTALIDHLKSRGVMAVFHYVPLHTAKAGQQFARFEGVDRYTTIESERLLRLPVWYGLTPSEQDQVISAVNEFYQ